MKRKSYEEMRDLFLKSFSEGKWEEAIVWSTELLQLTPDEPRLWAQRGNAVQQMGHPVDAILHFEKALIGEEEPTQIAAMHTNLGACYWDMWQHEKALKHLNLALDAEPLAATYLTMGNIHKYKNNLDKAIGFYRKSVELDPNYADAHMVLGMTLIKNGYLKEGFKEFEWRWKTNQLPLRKLKCPTWVGEDPTDKTILVYGEQGFGDIIQFSRYAKHLAARFPKAKVIVEGRPQLKRLLESMEGIHQVINLGEKLPELDFAVPMITLAGMMTPNMGAIPASDNKFNLKPEHVEAWKYWLEELPPGLRVGICWSGMRRDNSPHNAAVDKLRSVQLETFSALAKIPGIMWVSLQKGPPAEQVKTPPAGMIIADLTEDMYDFYETACAIENLDLVISVDTAVVHLAASLGKPTWLLSRWDGCWRWFGDREDSPWYPSLRQFVQPKPHDWGGLVEKVSSCLKQEVLDNTMDK